MVRISRLLSMNVLVTFRNVLVTVKEIEEGEESWRSETSN